MKLLKLLTLSLLISLLSLPSWSETYEDLIERTGLYYKKFTNVPFTGEVVGKSSGKIKNGKREGLWKIFHENGQFSSKAFDRSHIIGEIGEVLSGKVKSRLFPSDFTLYRSMGVAAQNLACIDFVFQKAKKKDM